MDFKEYKYLWIAKDNRTDTIYNTMLNRMNMSEKKHFLACQFIVLSSMVQLCFASPASAQVDMPKLKPISSSKVELMYTPFKETTSYGYKNSKGKIVIPSVFKEANDFDHAGTAIIRTQSGFGVINNKGEYVIEPRYESIVGSSKYCAHYFICSNNGEYDVIDISGTLLGSYQAKELVPMAEHVFVLQRDSPYDKNNITINSIGKPYANLRYIDEIKSDEGDPKYIIGSGKVPTFCKDGTVKYFLNGDNMLNSDNNYPCYGEDSDIALTSFWTPVVDTNKFVVEKHSDTRLVVRDVDSFKSGVVDFNGNIILPCQYDRIQLKNLCGKPYFITCKYSKWYTEFVVNTGIRLFGNIESCSILDNNGAAVMGPFDDIEITDNFIYTAKSGRIAIFNTNLEKIADDIPICKDPSKSKFSDISGKFYSPIDKKYYLEIDGELMTVGVSMKRFRYYSYLLRPMDEQSRCFFRSFDYSLNMMAQYYDLSLFGIDESDLQNNLTQNIEIEVSPKTYSTPRHKDDDWGTKWFYREYGGDYFKCAMLGEAGDIHLFADSHDKCFYFGKYAGEEGKYSATILLKSITGALAQHDGLDLDSVDKNIFKSVVQDSNGDYILRFSLYYVTGTNTFVYDAPTYVNIAGVPIMVNSGMDITNTYDCKNVVVRLDGKTLKVKNVMQLPSASYSTVSGKDGWYAAVYDEDDDVFIIDEKRPLLKFDNTDKLIYSIKPQEHFCSFAEDKSHGLLYLGGYTDKSGYIGEENQYIGEYSLKDGSFIASLLPKAVMGCVKKIEWTKEGQLTYTLNGSKATHVIESALRKVPLGDPTGAFVKKYTIPWGNTTLNCYLLILPYTSNNTRMYKQYGFYPGMHYEDSIFSYKEEDGRFVIQRLRDGELYVIPADAEDGLFRVCYPNCVYKEVYGR